MIHQRQIPRGVREQPGAGPRFLRQQDGLREVGDEPMGPDARWIEVAPAATGSSSSSQGVEFCSHRMWRHFAQPSHNLAFLVAKTKT